MDEPVPYVLSERGLVTVLAARVAELEEMIRHLDRQTLDLLLYAQSVPAVPDRYEWSVVLDLIREVRDAYGLRTPDR